MSSLRPTSSEAGELSAMVVENIQALEALSLSESFGVHRLCAGLYAKAYRRLLAHFETLPDPAFTYLVMIRFHALYVHSVVRPALKGRRASTAHWRAYAALAARSTMSSPASDHFRLLSLGARAHVRHDLVGAICLAVADHQRLFGRAPNLDAEPVFLLGTPTSAVFYRAALDCNAMHLASQRGWRRVQLMLHAALARISRPFWLAVLQSWRQAAWREAMAKLAARRPRA